MLYEVITLRHPQAAQEVTGVVVGHLSGERGPGVGHPQDLDEELRQFVDPRREPFGNRLAARVGGEQLGVMMLHHAGAGTGRNDDRPVIRKQRQLMGGNASGFFFEAAAVGRLAATGLVFRKVHADALAFKQGDGIEAGTGKELVDDAGRKKIDSYNFV